MRPFRRRRSALSQKSSALFDMKTPEAPSNAMVIPIWRLQSSSDIYLSMSCLHHDLRYETWF